MSCPGIVDSDFLGSALRFADCQAQVIGMQGYHALAASNSPIGILLTGLLTIMVAFFGYRMLLGHVPDGRDGVLAFIRIGLVLALATSWAAYRVVIYDVALHGPAEIVGAIGGASGVPGATGGLVSRLGEIDRAMIELSRIGVTGVAQVPSQPEAAPAPGNEQEPPQPQFEYSYEPSTIFGSSSLGSARLVFLTATIAAYASVRLVAGLLLAVGPLFITFLLFEGTRSLFEGWLRALIAAAAGALAVTMTLGVELALLEPWLSNLLSRRYVGLPTAASGTELLVISLAFALILVGALGVAARLALAFRLPLVRSSRTTQNARPALLNASHASRIESGRAGPGGELSRAAAVAGAVAIAQRRESSTGLIERTSPAGTLLKPTQRGREESGANPAPLGQGYRRRSQTRISASARNRDVKS